MSYRGDTMNDFQNIYEFSDVQEAAECLRGLKLKYRQLGRGPLHATIKLQNVGEIGVSWISLDRLVEGEGYVEAGQALLLLCTGGQANNRYDEHLLSPGQVYLRMGNALQGHQLLRPGYQAVAFSFPSRLLEECLARPLESEFGAGVVLDLNPKSQAKILCMLAESQLLESDNQNRLSGQLISEFCEGLGLSTTAEDQTFSKLQSKIQLAKAIRERIQNRPEMSVSEICGELFISERTLRRVFTEVYETSPVQYSMALRLNTVKRELCRARQRGQKLSISRVASREGFGHMGRFCSQYRRLFGECPSHTLSANSGTLVKDTRATIQF